MLASAAHSRNFTEDGFMLAARAQITARHLLVALTTVSMLLSGCALFDLANPKEPTIKLDSVVPQSIGRTVQRLEIGLLVQNPNRFDLHIQELNFTALVNGENFAKGNSSESATVPASSEALLKVQVELGLADLLSQAAKLFTAPEQGPLQYGVSGTVTLENWPTDIPFDVVGEYSNPLQ